MKTYKDLKSYLTADDKHVPIFHENFNITTFDDFKLYGKSLEIPQKYRVPHKTDFFEISVIVEDTTNIKIGEYHIDDINSTAITISPHQVKSLHPIDVASKTNYGKGYVIYFKPEFIGSSVKSFDIMKEFSFFKIQTTPVYHLNKEQLEEVVNILERMHEETKNNRINNYEIIKSYFFLLLYQIKRISYTENSIVSTNRFELITFKFEQTIEENKESFLTVSEYANKMNISPVYLNECVKKATGNSAQQTINDYKILHAKSLLNQSEKPIVDIASELGYSEMTNFTRFFKKNTGVTPLNFRKNCLGNDKIEP